MKQDLTKQIKLIDTYKTNQENNLWDLILIS
ncbi:hypothetical protein BBUCA8_03772 [Borreliella burgdorferi CA8]|nr:hypothetical protein BBUCA8_03772 [Borreliella burgdorferi CA8]